MLTSGCAAPRAARDEALGPCPLVTSRRRPGSTRGVWRWQLVQLDPPDLQRGPLMRPDPRLEIRVILAIPDRKDQFETLPARNRVQTKFAPSDDLLRFVADDIELETGQHRQAFIKPGVDRD